MLCTYLNKCMKIIQVLWHKIIKNCDGLYFLLKIFNLAQLNSRLIDHKNNVLDLLFSANSYIFIHIKTIEN